MKKTERFRVASDVTPEQYRLAEARDARMGSSVRQELFLMGGGTVYQWYSMYEPEEPAREKPVRVSKERLESQAKVIAYRMASELADELRCTLKPKEIYSLCKAAIVIAAEPSEEERARLDKYTVDKAFDMVASGH